MTNENSQAFNFINWAKRLHRRQGILNRELVLNIIPILLEELKRLKDQPDEIKETLSFITSIVRQALAFKPFDYELFKLMLKVYSLYNDAPSRIPWLVELQKYYRFFDNSVVRKDDKSTDWLNVNKLDLDALNPLIVLRKVLEIWEYGDWELMSSIEKNLANVRYRSLLSPYVAWICFRAVEYDIAEKWLSFVSSDSFLTFNLRAEMAIQSNDLEKAVDYWAQSLAEEPYQPWILYRLYELNQSKPRVNILNNKKIYVLFYTYNKRDSLVKTFESLMNSYIGDAKIIILNNGSTVFSPNQLEKDILNIAQGRSVSFIHLPVNIGAPAARNWLYHIPEVQQSDYLAFLDDDVYVPKDWLLTYVDDLESFPDTVVVGPMVVNPDPLFTPQWIYLYFLQTGDDKIRFTPIIPLPFDIGQYSLRRPCLCVMGCCHLFHTKRWQRFNLPDFDIRFSPSQVDDIEHNIQAWKCGGRVFFDGRVKVVHVQTSGKGLKKSVNDYGHIVGNHVKMEAKFIPEELVMIYNKVTEADDAFWDIVFNEATKFIPMDILKILPYCWENRVV